MVTIASVSFKLKTFESAVVVTTFSILKAVVPTFAAVRILKWKMRFAQDPCGASHLAFARDIHQLRREHNVKM
jgi:hypothetical protein